MDVIQAQTAMTADAAFGTVVPAGGDISPAPPPHSDDVRNVPGSYRLDTKFTAYPCF
jgi:hypothetical protein